MRKVGWSPISGFLHCFSFPGILGVRLLNSSKEKSIYFSGVFLAKEEDQQWICCAIVANNDDLRHGEEEVICLLNRLTQKNLMDLMHLSRSTSGILGL